MAIIEGLKPSYELKYWKTKFEMDKMSREELITQSEFLLWRSLLLFQQITELKQHQVLVQTEPQSSSTVLFPDSLG